MKIDRKVAWCRAKFIKEEITELDEWTKRISEGSGSARQRVDVIVPKFGEVKLNECEIDCLRLPTKYALYPSVSAEGTKLESNITDGKIKWNRRNRDFDHSTGQEVIEPEEPMSMEEQKMIIENCLVR